VRRVAHVAAGTVAASIVAVQGDTMVQVSSSETSIDVGLAAVRVKPSENDPPEGHGANVAVAGGICAAVYLPGEITR
jgi:hypothetical protein